MAEEVRLITCRRHRCATRPIEGTTTFATVPHARASLTRGRVRYASGTLDRATLVLHARRRLRGRFMLTLRDRDRGRLVTTRTPTRIR